MSESQIRALEPAGVLPYLQLMRPANMVTAAADVLAGFAAAGMGRPEALPWLLVATMALYAGGVVFNDVCDARLDAVERPERPIPSGRASLRGAAALGTGLFVLGIAAASVVGPASGALAGLIAVCAFGYDAWGKHRGWLGPLNMGLCRGLNLLLGVSVASAMLTERWYLAALPIAYIAAITAVSRGEVHGGQRSTGMLALGLMAAVGAGLLALGLTAGFSWLALLPFWALLAYRVVPPFWRAYRTPEPGAIRQAVMAGVLSLIALDAAIAAGYAGPLYGLAVLALLWVAGRLARAFAVT